MIQQDRVQPLNSQDPAPGHFILYWMQASQRALHNHALEYAIDRANERSMPVVVLFCLMDDYPEGNERHYVFMLEGIRETIRTLRSRNIPALVKLGHPVAQVPRIGRQAYLVVTDRGYLRHQKDWRAQVAAELVCPLVQVESDAIVPVESASPKADYTAATLRPKIGRIMLRYMVPLQHKDPVAPLLQLDEESIDIEDVAAVLARMKLDRSVPPVTVFRGGTSEAERLLATFLDERLQDYAEFRSNPGVDCSSRLSPYLHFGQVSPLYIALQTRDRDEPGVEAFLEQLIIRRELSLNFVHWNEHFDNLAGLPGWARSTLAGHAADSRPYIYELATLEQGGTHDPYWNAAQREMVQTGSMHNYMRMYWGKKILEWSPCPSQAFAQALFLNNRWQLDGRDPNSYAGVAWCFGMHDRPWSERPVFGRIRYMNARGLERKFNMKAYLDRIGIGS